MEELKKRIAMENDNYIPKPISNNSTHMHYLSNAFPLFERLHNILYLENKKAYYIRIVMRLFSYICIYLEKINSNSISIVYKNGQKYYYSTNLNIDDVYTFYENTNLAESTKVFYVNILKKYIKILNNEEDKFYGSPKFSYIKKKNTLPDKTLEIIQNLKNLGNTEYICLYYALNFLGLTLYQVSQLKVKDIKQNCNLLSFVSYRYKKKIIVKKKINKVLKQYFLKFFKRKRNKGFLFFPNIKGKIGYTRKNQIKKRFAEFMKKKLKLSDKYIKSFINFIDKERTNIRLGKRTEIYFDPDIYIITKEPLL